MGLRLFSIGLIVWIVSCHTAGIAAERAETGRIDFARDVYPILETYCVGCHSADDPQGGLVMDSYTGLAKGGDSGLAVTPGVPASSRLLLMITGKLEPVMPPDDAEGPDEDELDVLSRWIEQGAAGPEGDLPIRRTLRTPSIEPSPSVAAPVTAIAVSNDGRSSARAMFGRIEVLKDENVTAEIRDQQLGKINSLAFSSDAQRLLVASGLTGAYGRAAIYDTGSGDLIREFVGHKDTLYAAAFSPDESHLATAGYDRTIVLWDVATGEVVRELTGHNGAIFDLAFSPDGSVLVSACADETVKVWNVENGIRLDTLSQPEGEVYAVAITHDGRFIVAVSADNRLRAWRLRSTTHPRINPLVATRFIDETGIVNFAIAPDDRSLVAISESGNVKLIRTADWQPVASLETLNETGTDLFITPDSRFAKIALMNGQIVARRLPPVDSIQTTRSGTELHRVLMDLGEPTALDEIKLRDAVRQSGVPVAGSQTPDGEIIDVDRNVTINGTIAQAGQADRYRWRAGQGEVWAIDADATSDSRIDPIVTVLDDSDQPVLRVRLQAVRDSYFTFRGKDSDQISDFRVFNWEEMNLGEYLFAAGEVTRLQLHPRGPDSGFNVYPGEGKRWTYFGTSGTTHALGEPAYIVRPLPPGAEPLANGLPVFDVTYENDDDPQRLAGKNSRLLFTAPQDGLYTVRIADTRGEGGDDYGYALAIRPAEPGFRPSSKTISKPLHPATGREFQVQVDRIDGYDGPVTFQIDGLPDRLVSNFPLTIEAGQRFATGMIWADPNEKGWEGEIEPTLTAWAMVAEKRVERKAGSPGKLKFDPGPAQVISVIKPAGAEIAAHENWTLQVPRGETVSARVLIQRREGFKNEVSFGKEQSGRNASQGVYVDNIGLNGLLILAGQSDREFFVTADKTAVPGKRSFFLTANIDGGLTSHPITVEVLP
ncbi:WD domain, G-beta repeat [Stieleria maiorica]|uniref:WD domain, G-beta repeat n=1 Tax=Stieleria maiorica TaxID=2795974 RepID=A0A5B9MFF5_9BACT|nr:c-type cytochrome domain-containing protein [Stieleria maiorica]QEF99971.1 WD domain, G-beta repeat [Stieleria maiorica]